MEPNDKQQQQEFNLPLPPTRGAQRADGGGGGLPQIIGNPKAVPPVPALIPVSKSTWWAGVKSGRYPQPVRTLGERITAWRVEDIRSWIERATISDRANYGGK